MEIAFFTDRLFHDIQTTRLPCPIITTTEINVTAKAIALLLLLYPAFISVGPKFQQSLCRFFKTLFTRPPFIIMDWISIISSASVYLHCERAVSHTWDAPVCDLAVWKAMPGTKVLHPRLYPYGCRPLPACCTDSVSTHVTILHRLWSSVPRTLIWTVN